MEFQYTHCPIKQLKGKHKWHYYSQSWSYSQSVYISEGFPNLIFQSGESSSTYEQPESYNVGLLKIISQHFVRFPSTQFYSWVERGTTRVKCLTQEHNT